MINTPYINNDLLFVEIESERVKFWNPENSLKKWNLILGSDPIEESLDEIIERESKFDPLKEIKEKYDWKVLQERGYLCKNEFGRIGDLFGKSLTLFETVV